jgi:hypothetical protein
MSTSAVRRKRARDARIDAAVEIEEEVGTAEHRLGRALTRAAEAEATIPSGARDLIEDRPATQSVAFHPPEEDRRRFGRIEVRAVAWQLLEPEDVAPELAQPIAYWR